MPEHRNGPTDQWPKGRRGFLTLLGAFGVTGLAGCGGDDGGGDTPTETTAGGDDNGDDNATTGTEEPGDVVFEVAELTIEPEGEIGSGETITVSAEITNTGEDAGTQTVEYRIDGTVEASRELDLDGFSSGTVTFEDVDTGDLEPGEGYEHGVYTENDERTRTFDVGAQPLGENPDALVSFGGPVQVAPGAETTIAATLTNAYLFDIGSVEVLLSAPDELEVSPTTDTSFDSVESQGTRSLEWDLVVPDATGEFELEVSVTYASNTDEADVSTTVPVVVSRTLQAENADEMTDSVIDADHTGYNGDGFFNFDADTGARAVYSDIDGLIGDAGEKTITFRYALDGERTIALAVNGERRTEITFTSTGGWNSWETLSVTVELEPGDTIALETIGDEGPNIDQFTFADA